MIELVVFTIDHAICLQQRFAIAYYAKNYLIKFKHLDEKIIVAT
ncbi:hypothetical protein [Nodularia sp. NIES-3585]|nr:hypothetical protein [Nodularia sp. NIES-3585]